MTDIIDGDINNKITRHSMKRKIIIITLLAFSLSGFSQKWIELLPKKMQSEYTLDDYKKAFNEYWEPFNVKNGKFRDKNGKIKKAPGWKQFKRWEWYMEGQVDPVSGDFPKTNSYIEFKKYQSKEKALKATSANWSNLGTNYSDGGYAGIGRINCIAFHPSDQNTYWIGAPAGGLWVTTDDGLNWSCLTDNNGVLGVSDIIIPTDYETSKTIYIATGDRDSWDNNSIGILKSVDRGLTWQTTGLTNTIQNNKMINKLLLDPSDNLGIIAATSSGIYKTIDGGGTFNQLSTKVFIDIEYKPDNFNYLYGSTKNGEIWYSEDGGINWIQGFSDANGKRVEIAVSPAEPTWVYAVIANSENGLLGVYKSINSGIDFSLLSDNINLLGWEADGSDEGGQGYYDLSIVASPSDADVVLIGGINTWKSTNGGSTWQIVNHWYGDGVQAVHADKHNLRYRSDGVLFEVNDGGIYKSLTDGANGSWTDKSNGLVISQIYRLGSSQITNNEIITGLQDNGSKLYTGDTWVDVKGGDGMECLIDYTDDDVQYATYVKGQISRTLNHWSTSVNIQPVGTEGAWVTPYVMHPEKNRTLFAGYSDIWRTTDRGNNWQKMSSFNTEDKVRSISICEVNPNIIYVADRLNMWKSTNGGENWSSTGFALPSNTITSIAIKNDDKNTIWVTFGGYAAEKVYQSIDGGLAWTDVSQGLPNLPVNTIVYNKNEKGSTDLYVGTDVGVYYKTGTSDWVYYNTGLPNVKVDELEIFYDKQNPANSKLRAATYGRGLWESDMESSGNFTPFIETFAASNLTKTTATLNAKLHNDFGSSIIESGFVYSTNEYPIIGNANVIKIQSSPLVTAGDLIIDLAELSSGQTYYVRSYAINANGVNYGKSIEFNTACENIVSFPLEENFENGMPVCWVRFESGENPIIITPEENLTENGGYSLQFSSNQTSSEFNQYLISPAIDLVSEFTDLEFSHKKSSNANELLEWGVSLTDNILDFTWTPVNLSSTQWLTESVDLSTYSEQTIFLGFHYFGDNLHEVFIDDIKLHSITSIEQLTKNGIKIYPNPTSGELNISFNELKNNAIVTIFDLRGKVIQKENIKQKVNTLNMNSLPKGVYLLQLDMGLEKFTTKFMIK